MPAGLPASPTATLAPPSATPTPMPQESPEVLLLQNANCRTGPSTLYDIVTSLHQGQTADALGRNQAGTWFNIQVPDIQYDVFCWVSGSTVQLTGELSSLAVFPEPPTPTRIQGCWGQNCPQCPQVCTLPCPPNAQPGGACTP
jgi:hypothetical protein